MSVHGYASTHALEHACTDMHALAHITCELVVILYHSPRHIRKKETPFLYDTTLVCSYMTSDYIIISMFLYFRYQCTKDTTGTLKPITGNGAWLAVPHVPK